MKFTSMRAVGIKCFEDTHELQFGKKFNIFVGHNNSGKSALLQCILHLQGFTLQENDMRAYSQTSWMSFAISNISPDDQFNRKQTNLNSSRLNFAFRGDQSPYGDLPQIAFAPNESVFLATRPLHILVPFLSKRKASEFSEVINSGVHSQVTGKFTHLYSNIDLLATSGHPNNAEYVKASNDILGVTITTKPSPQGKIAGFYFDANTFIPLDKMGEGVTEIVALMTELCLSEDKVFILEEPESNLHPRGLKALLKLVRTSSEKNQFFIATHSNILVRELGGTDTEIFYIYRDHADPRSASIVESVEKTPAAHMRLLRELGYEFSDLDLHEGWLFLEESSAERIIRDVLIPAFTPFLAGRLRTYATGGVDNLEPTVMEFTRLLTFVHLQPVYEGRFWLRADGDLAGSQVIEKIRKLFPNFDDSRISTFLKPQFEYYYPATFQERAAAIFSVKDRQTRRKLKTELLDDVLAWTTKEPDLAKAEWAVSASEQIALLTDIESKIRSTKL